MGTLETQRTWLKVAAVIVGSFGPLFFLGSMEATAGLEGPRA